MHNYFSVRVPVGSRAGEGWEVGWEARGRGEVGWSKRAPWAMSGDGEHRLSCAWGGATGGVQGSRSPSHFCLNIPPAGVWRKHLREPKWIARHSLISHCDRPEENTGSQNKSGALGLERRIRIQPIERGQDLVKMKSFVSWKTCLTVFLLIPECHVCTSSKPPVLVILGSQSHSPEPSVGPCSRVSCCQGLRCMPGSNCLAEWVQY